MKYLTIINSHIICIILILFGYILPPIASCLEPEEVLILVSSKSKDGMELAEYYMKQRNIPKKNILKLGINSGETCDRREYNKLIARPVRRYIKENDKRRTIKCLLIMCGLPLRIISGVEGRGNSDNGVKTSDASLDSELALVLEQDYAISGWRPNPFYVGYGQTYEVKRGNVFMISRLDGPNKKIVKRIIDDSVTTEKKGLKGNAYFDARWPRGSPRAESAYEKYDHSLFLAADLIKKSGIMPVKINDKTDLYQKGECPEAALYCGWYSLTKYIDAFQWKPGSIGYHIASGECQTLKRPGSQVWCKRMLEEGIAATIGPVSEPYVQAFPLPELFFRFIIDGYWTLAESYALSQPYWSWQMVLIGDPLYRPFKVK